MAFDPAEFFGSAALLYFLVLFFFPALFLWALWRMGSAQYAIAQAILSHARGSISPRGSSQPPRTQHEATTRIAELEAQLDAGLSPQRVTAVAWSVWFWIMLAVTTFTVVFLSLFLSRG